MDPKERVRGAAGAGTRIDDDDLCHPDNIGRNEHPQDIADLRHRRSTALARIAELEAELDRFERPGLRSELVQLAREINDIDVAIARIGAKP